MGAGRRPLSQVVVQARTELRCIRSTLTPTCRSCQIVFPPGWKTEKVELNETGEVRAGGRQHGWQWKMN